MAPTICSGKKRQTRTIVTTNIRRHGQGPHQVNQTLSNIVNFVARSSLNTKVSTSLKMQALNLTERKTHTTNNRHSTKNQVDLKYNHLTHTSAASASKKTRQQMSVISDNAVTSSTPSDTENSFYLRLATEVMSNDTTSIDTSNATSSLPSPSSDTTSLSSQKEKTSSPSSQCQESLFERYSRTVMQATDLSGDEEDGSGNEETETDSCKNASNRNQNSNPDNKTKHYFRCSRFDSDESELKSTRDLNSDMSGSGSDTDMETDESDSMTSLDTEKSAKLKRGNHLLLRDKLVAKKNTKLRNTDGLLSIAIKTIKLVKRNQLLQQRLTQLQQETSEFIQAVLANPENRHFRENIEQKV